MKETGELLKISIYAGIIAVLLTVIDVR